MLDLLVKENKGEYNNLCTVGVVHSDKINDGFI